MTSRQRVVLTGAWGGGKTSLLKEIGSNPGWSDQFIILPEAAPLARRMGFDPAHPDFERVVVNLQHALEEAADTRLDESDGRPQITHRGSLDALGFWLLSGRDEADFFKLIGSSPASEHARYEVVLFFQTTACGVTEVYRSYCEINNRPHQDEAIRLDRFLRKAWEGHPRFVVLENNGATWHDKLATALSVIRSVRQ